MCPNSIRASLEPLKRKDGQTTLEKEGGGENLLLFINFHWFSAWLSRARPQDGAILVVTRAKYSSFGYSIGVSNHCVISKMNSKTTLLQLSQILLLLLLSMNISSSCEYVDQRRGGRMRIKVLDWKWKLVEPKERKRERENISTRVQQSKVCQSSLWAEPTSLMMMMMMIWF